MSCQPPPRPQLRLFRATSSRGGGLYIPHPARRNNKGKHKASGMSCTRRYRPESKQLRISVAQLLAGVAVASAIDPRVLCRLCKSQNAHHCRNSPGRNHATLAPLDNCELRPCARLPTRYGALMRCQLWLRYTVRTTGDRSRQKPTAATAAVDGGSPRIVFVYSVCPGPAVARATPGILGQHRRYLLCDMYRRAPLSPRKSFFERSGESQQSCLITKSRGQLDADLRTALRLIQRQ